VGQASPFKLLDSIDGVFLDIGSTLVMGPHVSPNKEIVSHFALEGELASRVSRLIMCTNFDAPADVCNALSMNGVVLNSSDGEFVSKLWSDQEDAARPIEGALETVQFLKQAGKKLGLLSDIWSPYYRAFRQACPEISDLVDFCVLSFEVGFKKPDPAFFELAISRSGLTPDRILMVGDTYDKDIEPAMTAHMKTAWVLSRPEREVAALVGVIQNNWARPDLTIARISDLQAEAS